MRHRCDAGHALRQEADPAQDSHHHRRHELWRAGRQCQGSNRPRRDLHGHQHDDRRWRHDPGRTPVLEDPCLSGAAFAIRPEPRRSTPRRCDRGGDRAGRQARRRRHAAGPEDHRARGQDAQSARGHRSAQRLPPSRLDRPRRSHHQDPGDPRDHRLGEADLCEGRRYPHEIRRRARREGRRRCGGRRRHAGRHRGHTGRLHRACGHSHARRQCASPSSR